MSFRENSMLLVRVEQCIDKLRIYGNRKTILLQKPIEAAYRCLDNQIRVQYGTISHLEKEQRNWELDTKRAKKKALNQIFKYQ